jgi:hypothetical protein
MEKSFNMVVQSTFPATARQVVPDGNIHATRDRGRLFGELLGGDVQRVNWESFIAEQFLLFPSV